MKPGAGALLVVLPLAWLVVAIVWRNGATP